MVGTILMLQATLLGILSAECIFYAWLCFHLSARGVAPGTIAAIVIVIAALWRLSHALGSFVLTSALRARDRRALPWGNSLAALRNELAARFICFNWSQPFQSVALGADPLGGNSGMPVLLVHGYVCNRGLWVSFRRRLAEANPGPIYTISLVPLFGGIDALVPSLDARIEEICAETGSPTLMIVAHSMGGLVTRAYMMHAAARAGESTHGSRVSKFVSLGTPHHGTQLARFGFGLNTNQMRAGSDWLQTLANLEATASVHHRMPPTLSIYTLNDDLVYPPESSVLAWAENVPVSAIGHMGLVFSEAVAKRVAQFLR
ncbi:MAG: hypothetical protein ABL931_12545 [Usitatibacteraceae bacterium]